MATVSELIKSDPEECPQLFLNNIPRVEGGGVEGIISACKNVPSMRKSMSARPSGEQTSGENDELAENEFFSKRYQNFFFFSKRVPFSFRQLPGT